MGQAPAQLASGYAYLYQREIEQRASGELPDERFVDVHFDALVRDPVGTVEDVYGRLGWSFTDEARSAVSRYAASKPKDSRGVHRYSLDEIGLDGREERERFRFYTEHYGVTETTASRGSRLLAGQDAAVGQLGVFEVADVVVLEVDLHPGEFAAELVGRPARVVVGDR